MPGYAYSAVATTPTGWPVDVPYPPPPGYPSSGGVPLSGPTSAGTIGTLPVWTGGFLPSWGDPVLDAKRAYLGAYWPLDENGGSRRDIFRGNTLIEVNDVYPEIPGSYLCRKYRAADCTAMGGTPVEDRLWKSHTSHLLPTTSFVLNLWFYQTAAQVSPLVYSGKDDATDENFQLAFNGGGVTEYPFRLKQAAGGILSGNFAAPGLGAWYMVTLTASNSEFALWLNGIQSSTIVFNDTIQSSSGTGWHFRLLQSPWTVAPPPAVQTGAYCLLDEVSLHTDIPFVDAAERNAFVAAMWNGGLGRYLR